MIFTLLLSSFWLLSTILSILLFRALAAARRRLVSISALSFSVSDIPQKIPDIVMVDSPPIQYRIGKKTLYIQALTIASQDAFLHEYTMFLKQYNAKLNGLKFYELDELIDIEDKAEMIRKAIEALAIPDIRNGFIRVIERVLLKDKLCNPDGITSKKLIKAISPNQLAQIFYAIYAYNIGAEKKNLRAMLEIIGMASNGDSGTDFFQSMKNGGTNRTNGYKSPFLDNPFYPEHLRKSTNGKKENEKNAISAESDE